ncbi:MAG: S-methyl-5-thioribose-1-phosphate isomerase [Ignavibacteriales bacterium]|nr:S-methyl-5-thioribose-1-phosphate isomerase [Ignavibacteriales bacterium]
MRAIEWLGKRVRFIDQTKLPFEEIFILTDDYLVISEAIKKLCIRGAPLIGVAAAYGVALASLKASEPTFHSQILKAIDELSHARPTAVNLFHALDRMKLVAEQNLDVETARLRLLEEALLIHQEDIEMCWLIGKNGAELISNQSSILTICNTGFLATGGEGTALSVINAAHRQGKHIKVFACETRPLLQRARLTTWELMKSVIDVTLITDNMAASLMQLKKIDCVFTGADRITANGDTANKIGTYSLAVLAHHHQIPFYLVAPSSTIDKTIKEGTQIPIEERDADEVREVFGIPIAPKDVPVWNPSFDVTPYELITAIITETGIHKPPYSF